MQSDSQPKSLVGKKTGEINATSQASVKAPIRSDILSGVAEAAVDVRKACNIIKRMASIGSASMVSGLDPRAAVEASTKMAFGVLQSIGFNTDDDARMESVMPMMMEATSAVLADAARNAPGGKFGPIEIHQAALVGVVALSEIAKSRVVAKMIEPAWPTDIDSTTALRLTSASAMAHLAMEVAEFDFMHSASECIKEAGKVAIKAAIDASAAIAPPKSSAAARLTLTQSLINSACKLYASSWHSVAADQSANLDLLNEDDLKIKLDQMSAAPLPGLLAPVNKIFRTSFDAATSAAIDMFPRPNDGVQTALTTPGVGRPRYSR